MKKIDILFIFLIILSFKINFYQGMILALVYFIILKVRPNLNKVKETPTETSQSNVNVNTSGIVLKCAKCGAELKLHYKFCAKCGAPFDDNNVKVEATQNFQLSSPTIPKFVHPTSFNSMFSLSEKELVETFLNNQMIKAGIDRNTKLIPADALKRKNIFNLIFSVLLFIYIGLIFFHFPLLTYIIGLALLIIFFVLTRSYTLMKYLVKQIKSRPNEKISNIVMHAKENLVKNNSSKTLIFGMIIAIILPFLIFYKPIILYEKIDGGYAVRYYISGITNSSSVTIPETYKGEKVISLRGNTFSNMPFLAEVTLPDTIIEIRGQAFKNDTKLTNIKLPKNLEYLGGGAFYSCISLQSIELPDSLTYLGGEAFYNARSLKTVKLSKNLTEIRGNTFEKCSSLESIIIPDSVTRIGGHAFYGNSSLTNVSISNSSKLKEVGSSAFRQCYRLNEITLPRGTYVNERAFKESPTKIKYYK